MTDIISIEMKNILPNVAGSWKNRIPTMTVPTAPMPVHTGYAVLMGSARVAFARRNMLKANDRRKPAVHKP